MWTCHRLVCRQLRLSSKANGNLEKTPSAAFKTWLGSVAVEFTWPRRRWHSIAVRQNRALKHSAEVSAMTILTADHVVYLLTDPKCSRVCDRLTDLEKATLCIDTNVLGRCNARPSGPTRPEAEMVGWLCRNTLGRLGRGRLSLEEVAMFSDLLSGSCFADNSRACMDMHCKG